MITLAGTPPQIQYGGMERWTTAPAETVAPRPIVTPLRIITFIPIHTSGSIITGLQNNKKVIVAPRLAKYDEHMNDHQLQITENFSKAGYILPLYENDDLGKILKNIKSFKPKKFKSNKQKMTKLVKELIDK